MIEKALMEICGGIHDGAVFEINLDPETGEPPPVFDISTDGQYLTNTNHTEVIGRRYGVPTLSTTHSQPTITVFDIDTTGGKIYG